MSATRKNWQILIELTFGVIKACVIYTIYHLEEHNVTIACDRDKKTL
jgi:hypothetical protein